MNKKILLYISGVVVVIIILLLLGRPQTPEPVKNVDPNTLPGIQTSQTPWQPELNHLRERLRLIGLPALSAEGTVLHIHQHIDIFIHKDQLTVPAGAGVNQAEGFISPIHTHNTSGVMHVESPTLQDFTLGQFFDIWGVRFTTECIGSYCANTDNALNVFVNGDEFTGDPRSLVLKAHQEIVVTYGSAKELPTSIPSTYSFEAGL